MLRRQPVFSGGSDDHRRYVYRLEAHGRDAGLENVGGCLAPSLGYNEVVADAVGVGVNFQTT